MMNGVCQSCGYGKRTQAASGNTDAGEKTRKKRKGSAGGRIALWICIAVGVLLALMVIVFLGASIFMAVRQAGQSQMPGYGYTDPYGGYFGYGNPYGEWEDDTSDYYVPDAEDEYYKQITDATSLELDYKVVWQSICLRPDDPDDLCIYDCVYPVLSGEDEAKFERMNRRIRELAHAYEDSYRDYGQGVTSYGYVTYMDEEKVSVVVEHQLNGEDSYESKLRAVTFLVETGEEIPCEQMQEIDEELVKQFRFRSSSQNGTVEFLEELSDEELKVCLEDARDSVMFYTPVGLEIGFNYEAGWVTVTLKNQTL